MTARERTAAAWEAYKEAVREEIGSVLGLDEPELQRPAPTIGDLLEVEYEGEWLQGTIVEEADAFWLVDCTPMVIPNLTIWKASKYSWRRPGEGGKSR